MQNALAALRDGWEKDSLPNLQKVVTFLDMFHPHQFDVWFSGFITESITAYLNSQHQQSCTKGIKERILTGLRGIDPGLDSIFKHAEAPLLMKMYLKENFNVYNESVQRAIATILQEKEIHSESSFEDAQRVLQTDLIQKLRQYEIEIPAEIQESIQVILEAFEAIYDKKIIPLL